MYASDKCTHCMLVINKDTKMKFSVIDLFSKLDQIRGELQIRSFLLKKSLMENFIVCAVTYYRLFELSDQFMF